MPFVLIPLMSVMWDFVYETSNGYYWLLLASRLNVERRTSVRSMKAVLSIDAEICVRQELHACFELHVLL